MIYCEKCQCHRAVAEFVKDDPRLVCGHIKVRDGNPFEDVAVQNNESVHTTAERFIYTLLKSKVWNSPKD